MKTPKVDYTGQRINYLTVVRFIPANEREGCRNRRDNVYVTYKGDSKTIAEWCDLLNFDRALAYHRHSRGWTGEEIFEKPKRICKRKE